jgi:hypothetical protein
VPGGGDTGRGGLCHQTDAGQQMLQRALATRRDDAVASGPFTTTGVAELI